MSNDVKAVRIAIIALVVAVVCGAGCILAMTLNNDGPTGLYIGDHEVTENGKLFDNKYGNLKYDKDSNTLYVPHTSILQNDAGYRVYDDIMLDYGVEGEAAFIISYEGTRPLNIFFTGDCRFIGSAEMDYVGAFYFAKEVTVNIGGPGSLNGYYVNHSLFYGEKATLNFNDIYLQYDGTIDLPIRAKSITVTDCELDFDTLDGYTGLYTSGLTVFKDSTVNASGFDIAMQTGPTFIYDSIIDVDASDIALRMFSCASYDSTVLSKSAGTGISIYNPLYFYGGYLLSDAQEYYALASIDTTIDIRDARVEANTVYGNAIQAWHILINNSDVKAESEFGSGIYANYNAVVDDENPLILIKHSNVMAAGEIGAVWSYGDVKVLESTIKSGAKVLSTIGPHDIVFSAICGSSEKALELIIEGIHAYPANACNKVVITATN